MKNITKQLVFAPAVFFLINACSSPTNKSAQEQRDTNEVSDTSHAAATMDQKTVDFMQKAMSGGLMEVELGKIAEKNGMEKRVKQFGSMMVTDHSAAGDELKSLAATKNIAAPAQMMEEHKEHVDELRNKTGIEFDKAYIKLMLKDHKEDIEDFKDAAEKETDPDVKALASKILPTLQKHLDSAKAINQKVKASLDPSDLTEGVETFPQR